MLDIRELLWLCRRAGDSNTQHIVQSIQQQLTGGELHKKQLMRSAINEHIRVQDATINKKMKDGETTPSPVLLHRV